MFCNNCGAPMEDGAKFCNNCGQACAPSSGAVPPTERPAPHDQTRVIPQGERPRQIDETMAMPSAAQNAVGQQGWAGGPQQGQQYRQQYQQPHQQPGRQHYQQPGRQPHQQPQQQYQQPYQRPAKKGGIPLGGKIAIGVLVLALVAVGVGLGVRNFVLQPSSSGSETSESHGSGHGHSHDSSGGGSDEGSGGISSLVPSIPDGSGGSDSGGTSGGSDSGSDSGGTSGGSAGGTTDSGGSGSGGTSGGSTAPDGNYIVTGIIVVMDSDSLAEADGVDPAMFDSSEMYAILLLDEPVEMQLQSGDGTGLREAETVSIICVGRSSAGTFDQWEPYSHSSDHITVSIDPYTTYWPSDVSLPVGEPRTSTATVVS